MGAWCAVTQDGCTVICYAQYGTNNATQWVPQAGPGTYAIKDFRDNYSQVFPCRAGCPGCQSGGGGGGGIAPPPDPTNPQPPSDGEDPPPREDPPNDGPITGPKPDPNPCGNSVPLGAPDAIPLNGSDQREALNWDREATRRDGFTHEQRFKQPNTIKIRFAPVVASMDADGPTLTTEGEIVMDGARMTARIPATTNGGIHFMPPELGVQHLYGNKGRSGTNGDAKMPRRVSQSFVNLWSDENDNGTTHSVILSSGVMAPGTTAPSNGWVLKREAPSGAGRLAIANTDANGAEDYTKPIRIGEYTIPTSDGDAGQVLVTDGAGEVDWSSAGAGDVTGPGTATGDNLTAFDGTTGKIIKDSGIAMADVAALLAAQVTVELASGTHELSDTQAPGRTRITLEDTDAGASIKSIHSDAPAVIHLWVQNTGPLVLINNDGTPSEDHWPIITGLGANATVFGGSGPVTLIRDDADEVWRMA